MLINNGPAPKNLSEVVKNIIIELKNNDHKLWKKSVCEMHYQYNELIFWIYMFNTDDVFKCYDSVVKIYKYNIGDFKTIDVNAYFYARNTEGKFCQFSFVSTKDFLNCQTDDGPLDVNVYDESDYDGQFIND